MAITYIVLISMAIVGGLAKAVMDTLNFHFDESVFKDKKALFWDNTMSWRNKYKNGLVKDGPRFPLSTTVFVFVTDAWHLFQSIFLSSILVSLLFGLMAEFSFKQALVAVIIYRCVFGIVFEMFFRVFEKLPEVVVDEPEKEVITKHHIHDNSTIRKHMMKLK